MRHCSGTPPFGSICTKFHTLALLTTPLRACTTRAGALLLLLLVAPLLGGLLLASWLLLLLLLLLLPALLGRLTATPFLGRYLTPVALPPSSMICVQTQVCVCVCACVCACACVHVCV